jgi:transposase-like protein
MNINVKISVVCPVCRSSQISQNGGAYICKSCNNTFTRQQIEKANKNSIKRQVDDTFKKQILPEIQKEFKKNLQKAFRGNPYIKIK